ncbi:hypothetical protein [Pontixanthobacter sp. CEM42]|uniref:hypothetical protein n=1 Tax=Pontixanthobacter sp. CEM42 TaxID=2792077 RepID=UPI001ADED6E1|nr:hypothetical protein [Pontixanthobacter sp. CEM42]
MMRNSMIALACATTLGGCAATSFAPPKIDLDHSTNTRSAFHAGCQQVSNSNTVPIAENFNGAMQLIDNFLVGYRCAERDAAEGRAHFEVPAFLFAATAALGQPFGISEDATIALGAAASGAGAGNSYFASQEKASHLNSAIDALTCIQLEAVGIPAFELSLDDIKIRTPTTTPTPSPSPTPSPTASPATNSTISSLSLPDLETSTETISTYGFLSEEIGRLQELEWPLSTPSTQANENAHSSNISIGSQKQYFRMIYGALLSVERILARRLSHAGQDFDADGIVAEIQLLSKQIEDNTANTAGEGDPQEVLEDAQEDLIDTLSAVGSTLTSTEEIQVSAKLTRLKWAHDVVIAKSAKDLQPKLQRCMVKAKI